MILSTQHSFCRAELAEVMKEVRERYTPEEIKKAWAWTDGSGNHFEFHGPHGEYIYSLNNCDCLWGAKAQGWSKLMQREQDEARAERMAERTIG